MIIGDKDGVAFTLMTMDDVGFAGDLVRNLENANQYIPPELLELAMQNPKFRRQRVKGGGGGGGGKNKGNISSQRWSTHN